ncbi:hypothetical protein [Ewingella americana]
MSSSFDVAESAPTNSWLGVLTIALGALSLVVTEFLPVGLLPGISSDLGIAEGTAGLIVSVTAILGFIAAAYYRRCHRQNG